MKRCWLLILVVGALTGCSDLHYLRQADSAYEYALGQHEQTCVKVQRVKDRAQYQECETSREKLLGIKRDLDAANAALIKGPLPGSARDRLKAIPKELE